MNDSEPVALSFDLVARDAGATRIVSQDLEAPSYRVIQESVAWETYRRKELTQTTNMAIDFEREIVLCVYLGEKPTGGFGVAITNIELRGQVVDVTLEFTQPPPGAMLLQVITSPYAIYRVALPDGVRPESGTFSLQFRSAQNGTDQPMVLHPLQ